MLSRKTIVRSLEEQQEALRRLGVKKLELFGSFARNQARAGSDLDFLVEFENKSFDAYMDLKFFLEDLFHKPVDLVIPGTIKPGLRRDIQGVLAASKKGRKKR